jgi:hypothetical protein
MCCSRSMHSAHCATPGHMAHGCHAPVHVHGCTGHRPAAYVAHHGCCSPGQEGKLAWLERRLEGLQQETKAVKERIAALQKDQDAQE